MIPAEAVAGALRAITESIWQEATAGKENIAIAEFADAHGLNAVQTATLLRVQAGEAIDGLATPFPGLRAGAVGRVSISDANTAPVIPQEG